MHEAHKGNDLVFNLLSADVASEIHYDLEIGERRLGCETTVLMIKGPV
jgi:hypothetical protein